MKANSFYNKNSHKRKKKQSFKKMAFGTDVRTVTQLIELKASPKRKLHIANQILAYTEKLLVTQAMVDPLPEVQVNTLVEIVADWKKAVKNLKAEIREHNIERSKIHTPFAKLLQ